MSDKGVLQFSPAPPRRANAAPASKAIPVPSWQRARDQSCAALLAGEMCVVVTGLPGTGKTLLVETVGRALRSTGWEIATFVARLPSDEEFAALAGSAAILIDDADRLSATELRTLNRLRQCSVLLAGAVGLEKRCPADSRVTLAPLGPEEVGSYVELWLAQAGLDPDLVAEPAIVHLADVSAGIPRVIAILLAASLKSARADGAAQIEDHHIDHAAWHHVEHTAARRLNRAASGAVPDPTEAKPAPAIRDADLEQRLSQAPFAESSAADKPGSALASRALGVVGFGLAFGLAVAAGVLTSRHWPQWIASVSSLMTSKRDDPAPTQAARPLPVPVPVPLLEPAAAAAATPPPQPPAPPATAESPPSAPALPPAAPALAQAPFAPASVPPVPLPAAPAPDPISPEVVKLLNQRGQQMIELNDYSAARLLFSRAAEAGSAKAMLALGRSFDPNINASAGPGAALDPAQAEQWYRKAVASGNSDAAILLQQLERRSRD